MGLYLVPIFPFLHDKNNDTKVQFLVLPTKSFNFTNEVFLERICFVSVTKKQRNKVHFVSYEPWEMP